MLCSAEWQKAYLDIHTTPPFQVLKSIISSIFPRLNIPNSFHFFQLFPDRPPCPPLNCFSLSELFIKTCWPGLYPILKVWFVQCKTKWNNLILHVFGNFTRYVALKSIHDFFTTTIPNQVTSILRVLFLFVKLWTLSLLDFFVIFNVFL